MHAPSRPGSKAAKNDQQTRSDTEQDGKMGAKKPNSTPYILILCFTRQKVKLFLTGYQPKKQNKNTPPCRPCKPKLQFKRLQNRHSTNSIADSAL